MDPNATLKQLRELAGKVLVCCDEETQPDLDDVANLAELFQHLDRWISRGGCLPRGWETKRG